MQAAGWEGLGVKCLWAECDLIYGVDVVLGLWPRHLWCVSIHVTRTNIRNAQSCCKRLASADVDQCTVRKSECTIRNIMADHFKYNY